MLARPQRGAAVLAARWPSPNPCSGPLWNAATTRVSATPSAMRVSGQRGSRWRAAVETCSEVTPTFSRSQERVRWLQQQRPASCVVLDGSPDSPRRPDSTLELHRRRPLRSRTMWSTCGKPCGRPVDGVVERRAQAVRPIRCPRPYTDHPPYPSTDLPPIAIAEEHEIHSAPKLSPVSTGPTDPIHWISILHEPDRSA